MGRRSGTNDLKQLTQFIKIGIDESQIHATSNVNTNPPLLTVGCDFIQLLKFRHCFKPNQLR